MREVVCEKLGDFEVRMETLSKKVDVLFNKKKKRTRKSREPAYESAHQEEAHMDEEEEAAEEEDEDVAEMEEEDDEEDAELNSENREDEVKAEKEEDEEEDALKNRRNEEQQPPLQTKHRKRASVEKDGETLEGVENELPNSSLPGETPVQNPQGSLEKEIVNVQSVVLAEIDTQDYARQVLSPGPSEHVYEQVEMVDEPPTQNIVVTQPAVRQTRLRKKFRFCLSPYMNPTMAMKVKLHPNPFAIQVSPNEWELLKSWVEEDEGVHPKKLKLKCKLVHEVDRRFFRTLLANDSWLSSDHVQTVVELLMSGADLIGVRGRCLYGPMFTFHLMQKRTSDHAWVWDKTLRKLDWTQMEKVLMTIHAKHRHWVLAEMDFPNETVRVYDSLKTAQSISFARPIIERLPALLRTVKSTDHQRSIQKWRVEVANDVPQQSDTYACGVMILAFAKYLLADLPLMPDCAFYHVDDFRRQYAARIFRMTAK